VAVTYLNRWGLIVGALLMLGGVANVCLVPRAGARPAEPSHVLFVYSLTEAGVLLPAEMARDAWPVVWCESRGDPGARSRDGDQHGLFQLSRRYHEPKAWRRALIWEEAMASPQVQADIAAEIWRASGWAPWTCRP